MSSLRQQIMDAVLTVLANIDGVNLVSEDIKHYEELDHNEFPALFPIDTDETKEPYVLYDSSTENMRSQLTVIVTGMVRSITNDTRQARCDMIQAVEVALCYTGSALINLTQLVVPKRVVTDKGTIDGYSIWDQEFEITYLYNYKTGE